MDPEVKRAIQATLFDPTNRASFTGKISLIRNEAQKLTEKKVSQEDVKQFRSENARIQLSRRRIKRFGRAPFYSPRPGHSFLIDSAFLPRLNNGRRGQRTLICIVDCFSRYAFVYECEGSPTGAKVIPILKTFMQHKRVNLKTLISDLVGTSPTVVACTVHFHTYNSTQGGEFTASNVAAFLKENQVLHITCSDPNTKAAICERFIRSIKSKVYQWVAASGSLQYMNVLQKLVQSYNEQKHTTIGMAPAEVDDSNWRKVYDRIYTSNWKGKRKTRFTLMLEQRVRISMATTAFTKSYGLDTKWSGAVYKVIRRRPSRPPRYELATLSGVKVAGSWYRDELQAVPRETKSQTILPITKTIRRRKSHATGGTELLVRMSDGTERWLAEEETVNGAIVT